MNDGRFEWDDGKAAANYAKHGISFDAAREVFKDFLAVDRPDDRIEYGEERFTIVGMVDGRLLFVAYTIRNETIRIISARGAEPREQRQYYQDNR